MKQSVLKKLLSILLILSLLSMTACTEEEVVPTTTEAATEAMTRPQQPVHFIDPAEVTTEVTTEATTEATTEVATEATTEATTIATEPTADENGVIYTQVEPYPIPIANPGKDIYDAPAGNYLRDFNTTGYYTIVEQAEDADGYTWGRLSTGEGWTMVYQQILPSLDLYYGPGAGGDGTTLELSGDGYFSGSSFQTELSMEYSSLVTYICNFDGYFMVTDIDSYCVSLEILRMDIHTQKGATWTQNGSLYIGMGSMGMDGDYFQLYFPNTPVNMLPSDCFTWGPGIPSYGTLGCYALYNSTSGETFLSY